MTNAKSNKQTTQGNTIDCPIISGNSTIEKDGKLLSVSFDLNNPSGSIGKLLDEVAGGTEFRLFGCTVTMPKGGDFSARFNNVVKQIFEASFATANNDEKPKTDAIPFLNAIKASGKVDFASLDRFSVMRGLNLRIANYREKIKSAKNATDSTKINAAIIAETGTYKKLNKAFKEGGRTAVLKELENMKGVKAIGWNS